MGRIPIIAGNWKMNTTWAQAVSFARKLGAALTQQPACAAGVQVVVCPPFTSLKGVEQAISTTLAHVDEADGTYGAYGGQPDGQTPLRLAVGAQDVCRELPQGTAAFTGDISAEMLFDLGCSYCIVGHSERRANHGETDDDVNAKVHLLLGQGITPIVCCGESQQCMQAGGTQEFIAGQVRAALQGLDAQQAASLVIAYEPIWAIGTGKVPTPQVADANCGVVRQTVGQMFGSQAAQAVRVLYGGSVKPDNAQPFLCCDNIDGALVGGASLSVEKFVQLVHLCHDAKGQDS